MGLVSTDNNIAPPGSHIGEKDNEEKVNKNDAELQILNKDEAKAVMKHKDFENFINKTSKIMERALNSEFDIMGTFFEESDADASKHMTQNKGDKITELFKF